jgi:hypothetical protein
MSGVIEQTLCLKPVFHSECSKGTNLKGCQIMAAFLVIFFQNGRSLNSSFSGGISSSVVCDAIF